MGNIMVDLVVNTIHECCCPDNPHDWLHMCQVQIPYSTPGAYHLEAHAWAGTPTRWSMHELQGDMLQGYCMVFGPGTYEASHEDYQGNNIHGLYSLQDPPLYCP